jgi:hypothetical protein
MNEIQTTNKPAASPFSMDGFEHAQRIAIMLSKSDLIPKRYQGNVQNAMIALEMATRIGASPLMVMQNLYVVNGNPGWSSAFIIGSINQSAENAQLKFAIRGKGMDMECYAWGIDKETNERVQGPTVTMAMAKAEGWIDKNGSKWKTMPELMIQYRAAAFFGRLYKPELLMGMQTYEEVIDIQPEIISQERPAQKALESDRMAKLIKAAETSEELASYQSQTPPELYDLFDSRVIELKEAGK